MVVSLVVIIESIGLIEFSTESVTELLIKEGGAKYTKSDSLRRSPLARKYERYHGNYMRPYFLHFRLEGAHHVPRAVGGEQNRPDSEGIRRQAVELVRSGVAMRLARHRQLEAHGGRA